MNDLAFTAHAGHFIHCQRLPNGQIRLEVQQCNKQTYVLLDPEQARLLGRLLIGGGPQLPELPTLRQAG